MSNTDRKRQHSETPDVKGVDVKRANVDREFQFKLMVPSVTAGVIIGKGGEKIASLQSESNAKIRMSKSNDYYPGTQERIAQIVGRKEAVMVVLRFVLESGYQKVQGFPFPDQYDVRTKIDGRSNEIKLLVPNSTAGMIIGKGGQFIKEIKEKTGAYVQVSKQQHDTRLVERVVTIAANDNDQLLSGAEIVCDKLAADDHSGQHGQTSYLDVASSMNQSQGGGMRPNSDPFLPGGPRVQHQQQPMPPPPFQPSNPPMPDFGAGNQQAPGQQGSVALVSSLLGAATSSPMNTAAFLNNLSTTLRSNGYAEASINEIMTAMQILAKYNILGLALGGSGGALGGGGAPTAVPAPAFGSPGGNVGRNTSFGGGRSGGNSFGGGGMMNMGNRNTGGGGGTGGGYTRELREVPRSTDYEPLPQHSGGGGDGGGEIEDVMEVPDHLVGVIIGREARTLYELQSLTNAKIKVSEKGVFAPGTNHRMVMLTGTAKAVALARSCIEHRLREDGGRQNTGGR